MEPLNTCSVALSFRIRMNSFLDVIYLVQLGISFEIRHLRRGVRSLEKAKQGKYHKNSLTFRKCPSFLEEKHFGKTDDYLVVKDSIKKMVTFRQLNLLDARRDIQSLPTFDIIFCCNVLI